MATLIIIRLSTDDVFCAVILRTAECVVFWKMVRMLSIA